MQQTKDASSTFQKQTHRSCNKKQMEFACVSSDLLQKVGQITLPACTVVSQVQAEDNYSHLNLGGILEGLFKRFL